MSHFLHPEQRYDSLSAMLSSVRLYPVRPVNCLGEFFDPQVVLSGSDSFCGRWNADDIAQTLLETGCFAHWYEQGYEKIWVELEPSSIPNRFEFDVWTQCAETSELLLQVVVWLEYQELFRLNASYPVFYVEHLRLQSPGKAFRGRAFPGQDYPSSGLLRRVFGILRNWACACGAMMISEIPEYYHTACLFSEFFCFADEEMEGLFRAVQRDLGNHDLQEISQAFERGQIRYCGRPWLWPTEIQAYGLSHDLQAQLRIAPSIIDSGHFEWVRQCSGQ